MRRNNIKRANLFLSSRVHNNVQDYENTLRHAEQSLKDIDCEYFDTYALNSPTSDVHLGVYQACETLLNTGLAKGISLNNYSIQDFENLLPYIRHLPNSNEMEVNPFIFRKASLEYFSERGIQIITYRLFGKGKYIKHPLLVKIAEKTNMTPAQILILWCLQQRLVVVTRSSKTFRIKENLKLDFNISEEDINLLNKLTTIENLLSWHTKFK